MRPALTIYRQESRLASLRGLRGFGMPARGGATMAGNGPRVISFWGHPLRTFPSATMALQPRAALVRTRREAAPVILAPDHAPWRSESRGPTFFPAACMNHAQHEGAHLAVRVPRLVGTRYPGTRAPDVAPSIRDA